MAHSIAQGRQVLVSPFIGTCSACHALPFRIPLVGFYVATFADRSCTTERITIAQTASLYVDHAAPSPSSDGANYLREGLGKVIARYPQGEGQAHGG